jgi:hypothetical protein
MFLPDIDEVHVSVAFTWDIKQAECLAHQWGTVCGHVFLGGPALAVRQGAFIPGMYLRRGYVITSRGCPNRCWFCSVWRREKGELIELPIMDGHNILDDNILACSEQHIRVVFAMLKRQPERAQCTGGLEAARLKPWHVDLLMDLHPKQIFFAYDEPRDLEPLIKASQMLLEAGFNRQVLRCYVLIGHPTDSFDCAELRLRQTVDLGFFPMAMLWRDEKGERDHKWMRFQKTWARPAAIHGHLKELSPPTRTFIRPTALQSS